ncbi:Mpo1 family 2-hydroxy fatty acid dioxygenase [Hydrogenophaga flava]|uniref:Mpo1 family 2-hydroxy fatty acid dioxygenase n=1 Tax=Hydrogenophaga flava TaxID=65657 RepID=UPI0008252EEA|nr:Mpo1-like protein [Hydrogenophaga flava]
METATRQLIEYARYHRDPRNIATHFVGIPLIAFGIAVMLARVPLGGADALLPGAHWLVWALTGVWYLRQGRWSLTVPTLAVLGVMVALADPLGEADMATWLAGGLGSFVVGWVFQAVGHVWEGRKPAFFDDLRGLLVGPMFVLAELLMALGLLRGLRETIEQAAGPVRRRAAPVAGGQ